MILSVAKERKRRMKKAAMVATAFVALLAVSPNPFAAEPSPHQGLVAARTLDPLSRG